MTGRSENFEDDQGNPDWARAGSSVQHSIVSPAKLDPANIPDHDQPESGSSLPLAAARRSDGFAAALLRSLIGIAVVSTSLVLFLNLGSVKADSAGTLGGVLLAGLLGLLLQRRSRMGLLGASAATFGVYGSRILLVVPFVSLGFLVVFAADAEVIAIPDLYLLLLLGLASVMCMFFARATWLMHLVSLASVVTAIVLFVPAATVSSPQLSLDWPLLADSGDFACAFLVTLVVNLSVPLGVISRLAGTLVVSLVLLFVDVDLGTALIGLTALLALAGTSLVASLFNQVVQLSPKRRGLSLMPIYAGVSVAVGAALGVIFQTLQAELILPTTVALMVWSLIQLPNALIRRYRLHEKSLQLGYGFYGAWAPIATLMYLALLIALLVVHHWLLGDWEALAASALVATVSGTLLAPRFLRAQREQRAAAERLKEKTRASSEDLQWSE